MYGAPGMCLSCSVRGAALSTPHHPQPCPPQRSLEAHHIPLATRHSDLHRGVGCSRGAALATFISLIGSSVCSLLGFVFPAMFHLKVGSVGMPLWEKVLDYFLIVFGLALAYGAPMMQ